MEARRGLQVIHIVTSRAVYIMDPSAKPITVAEAIDGLRDMGYSK